jgi:hypothetical protein
LHEDVIAELRVGDEFAFLQKYYFQENEPLAAHVRSMNEHVKERPMAGAFPPIEIEILGYFTSEKSISYKQIGSNDDPSVMKLEGYLPIKEWKDTVIVPPKQAGEPPQVQITAENRSIVVNAEAAAARSELGGIFYFPKGNVITEKVTDEALVDGTKLYCVDFKRVAVRVRGYSKQFEDWLLGICVDAKLFDGIALLPRYFEQTKFREYILSAIKRALNGDITNAMLVTLSIITEALNLHPTLVEHYKVCSIVLQAITLTLALSQSLLYSSEIPHWASWIQKSGVVPIGTRSGG